MADHSKLIELYQRMAEHTAPRCGSDRCRPYKPGGCCSREYCQMALEFARDERGVDLTPLWDENSPGAPFSRGGPCVVAPHLRPVCTMHVCVINNLGYDWSDPNWSDRYFELREQIDEVELQLALEAASDA